MGIEIAFFLIGIVAGLIMGYNIMKR